MKNFFTLLFLLFITNLAFSQIRLDSIILLDPTTQDVNYSFRFGYENGLLTSYLEDDLPFIITNNANGDFEKWKVESDYGTVELDFIYDNDANLDSIIFTSIEYGYESKQIYDMTYENDLLTKVIVSIDEYGYQYDLEEREYLYDNGRLDSIIFYDPYYGNELQQTVGYSFEEDKLAEMRFRDELGQLTERWVTSYDGEQIQALSRFSYFDDPLGELTRIYQFAHVSEIPFSDIISPSSFFQMVDFISFNEFVEYSIPMTYSTQIDYIEEQSFGEFSDEHIFYYSTFVGTNEERIAMTPISVSPNPTTDYIRIATEKAIQSYTILTIDGQVVSQNTTSENQIDVHSLSTGQYTIIVDLQDGTHVFGRFVKQ